MGLDAGERDPRLEDKPSSSGSTSSGSTAPRISGNISGTLDEQVEAFLAGLRQHESGNRNVNSDVSSASGYYQYVTDTWNGYGGYARAHEAPFEVQHARAKADALAAYNTYGNWADVAMAHFYPAFAGKPELWHLIPGQERGNAYPGNPTAYDYVSSVLSNTGMSVPTPSGGGSTPTTGEEGLTVGVNPFPGGTADGSAIDFSTAGLSIGGGSTFDSIIQSSAKNLVANTLASTKLSLPSAVEESTMFSLLGFPTPDRTTPEQDEDNPFAGALPGGGAPTGGGLPTTGVPEFGTGTPHDVGGTETITTRPSSPEQPPTPSATAEVSGVAEQPFVDPEMSLNQRQLALQVEQGVADLDLQRDRLHEDANIFRPYMQRRFGRQADIAASGVAGRGFSGRQGIMMNTLNTLGAEQSFQSSEFEKGIRRKDTDIERAIANLVAQGALIGAENVRDGAGRQS